MNIDTKIRNHQDPRDGNLGSTDKKIISNSKIM
jgi:hypothetical protein